MNDFEEFARQFRERTAQRLLEFENNLAEAQRNVEEAARARHDSSRGRNYNPVGADRDHQPSPASTPGRVRGVLKRG